MNKVFFAGLLLTLAPVVALAATLEERVAALEQAKAEATGGLAERLTFSGVIEVEATYESLNLRDANDEAASDLALATAQLGVEAALTEQVGATLVFLYEEEDDAVIDVDEATINYVRGPWSARVGRQYVPFGAFPSAFISDPVTLDLGETRETAVLLGYAREWFGLAAWAANGDAEAYDGVGHINDWGASITLNPAEFVELGASVLSDFADTDAELVANYQKRVPGWSAYAVVGLGPVALSGEVLGAVGAFHENDLDEDGDGSGDQPLAWNLEVAWEALEAITLAARVEGSAELLGAPEIQYGVCASWGPWEHVSLSAEYLHGEFDKDFGDGVDSRDLVTTQLAVEF